MMEDERLAHRRWVPSRICKDSSQVDDPRSVELELFAGRSARRGQANDLRCVGAPHEMVIPALKPGMKERHPFSIDWIQRFDADEFPVIASLASQGQILKRLAPRAGQRQNMLDRKSIRREGCLALAILAATIRSAGNLCFVAWCWSAAPTHRVAI